MKKIPILLFALMMAGGLSAQIEEVSAEQYAPKKEVQKQRLPVDPYPANLMAKPYALTGQKLYCSQDCLGSYYKPTPIVSVVMYPDSTIGMKRITKGVYYTVTEIINSNEQLYKLQTKLIKSKNYLKKPYIYIVNGKEKVYPLAKSKEKDIPGFLGNGGCLYVLSDDEGILYFVAWRAANYEDVGYVHRYEIPSGNTTPSGSSIPLLCSPSIGDFISVNTYNYLKGKYTNKELVNCEYYDPSCQRYYRKEDYAKDEIKKKYIQRIEKVGVEKNKIVFVLNRDGYMETKAYKKEGVCVIPVHKDTISGVFIEGYSTAFPFRADVDSLMKRWYQEELIKEAQARAEKMKQKAEYIKKYGEEYAQNIIDGKVCVGMTKEMCRKAMGQPNSTSKSTNSLGVVEVWTYSTLYQMFGGLAPIIVVTFLDDKVSSVEEYKDSYPL